MSWPHLECQGMPGFLPRIAFRRLRFDGLLQHDSIDISWSERLDPSIEVSVTVPEHDWIELTAMTRNPEAVLPSGPSLAIVTVVHPGCAIGRPLIKDN